MNQNTTPKTDINAARSSLQDVVRALPDIELVAAAVHEAWMESKRATGVTSRRSESGEELMVPYEQLTERSKDLDRGSVQAVYAAIRSCSEAP